MARTSPSSPKSSRRPPRRRAPEEAARPNLAVAGIDPLAGVPTPEQRASFLGTLLRFISCGVLSIAIGLAWRLTLAPARVEIGSALAGIVFLLLGFIVGGVLWYVHDVRLRRRAPEKMPDERIIFSFIVFVLVPLMVVVLVGAVWLLTLLIGG